METPQIEKYRHDLEIIRNTAQQVIKDFSLHGVEITFSGNELTAYDELKQQLIPALAKLHQAGTFTALLYRIDVDEKKVNEILNNSATKDIASQLASLVIEREFMKVLLRKLYSGSK
ncbi:MAG: hypothetical protein ACHQNT_09300 [Bacteroidia bacterium]